MAQNEIDSDIPKWINKDYLGTLLKIYFKDNTIKILNFHPKLATKKGENYVSLITRILIEYESYRVKYGIEKFIIKSSIEADPNISNLISEYQAFEDEMLMYNKVLPSIQKLLKTASNFNNISVFPKPIYCDFQQTAIILEDLLPGGYKLADRIQGLNHQHAKLALKKLAILHASSIILNQSKPRCFEKFDHGIYNRHTDGIIAFYNSSMHKICDILEDFSEEYQNYSKKIRNLIPHWIEKERKCYDPKPNQLNVLAHGDFWTNNVMYKYNESGEPIDAILIDFQFCVWASPAIDLHYFFHTSLADLPNFDEIENLIKFYHSELLGSLKLLNCKKSFKVPNFEEFLCELWDNGFHALQASFLNKSVALLEDNSAACPEAIFCEGAKSERFQWTMVNNKRIQEHWKILIPYFDKKGLFNV